MSLDQTDLKQHSSLARRDLQMFAALRIYWLLLAGHRWL
jgi:hypothetical protein